MIKVCYLAGRSNQTKSVSIESLVGWPLSDMEFESGLRYCFIQQHP